MTAQHIINHIEFSRKSLKIHDTIALSHFSRVISQLAAQQGQLEWTLEGQAAAQHSKPRLHLTMSASMQLLCQRCLKPLNHNLNVDQVYELVKDESEIPLDDDSQHEYFVISDAFDVLQLIEDELILAMPYAPKHDGTCDVDGPLESGEPLGAFAALKSLKLDRH